MQGINAKNYIISSFFSFFAAPAKFSYLCFLIYLLQFISIGTY